MAGIALIGFACFACGRADEAAKSPAANPHAPAAVEMASGDQPLNVVIVTLDTTRADALGAYDGIRKTSPNLDRLATEGVLFEQAVVSAPSTLPSHATIMTGKHPYAHGARSNNGYVLAHENVTLAERFKAAGYVTAAEIAARVIAARTLLDQGFDSYTDPNSFDARLKSLTTTNDDGSVRSHEISERDGSDITRRALDFLTRNREVPFFLWLHYFDPHVPYAAPLSYQEKFPDSRYHSEIAYTDMQIGRVIAELEKLGISDRTLVIVTSDHGEGLNEHGEETHAHFVYDTTIRVPLIFWGPKDLPRGKRISPMVRAADIAPTVLDWAGLPPLDDIQGRTLRPLVEGGNWNDVIGYGETIEPFATFGSSPIRYVRVGRWKYIHTVRPELYDVLADRAELDNRATQEPERVEELRSILRDLIENAPASPGAEVAIEAEVLAQLGALGYVGSASPTRIIDELATLEVSGTESAQMIRDLDRYAEASGAFQLMKEYPKAERMFEELLTRYPRSVPILRTLGETKLELDKTAEGVALLRRAVELSPDDSALRLTLVEAEKVAGNTTEAENALRVAIGLEKCGVIQIVKLSNLLSERRRYAEQKELLTDAMRNCPNATDLANDYAYLLATAPDATIRDGRESLRIALEVTRSTNSANPAHLDTLAAAYAENGEFGKAIETQRQAIELLTTRQMPDEVVALFRASLASYQAGKPVRAEH